MPPNGVSAAFWWRRKWNLFLGDQFHEALCSQAPWIVFVSQWRARFSNSCLHWEKWLWWNSLVLPVQSHMPPENGEDLQIASVKRWHIRRCSASLTLHEWANFGDYSSPFSSQGFYFFMQSQVPNEVCWWLLETTQQIQKSRKKANKKQQEKKKKPTRLFPHHEKKQELIGQVLSRWLPPPTSHVPRLT